MYQPIRLTEAERAQIHDKVSADFMRFMKMQAEERAEERREAEKIQAAEQAAEKKAAIYVKVERDFAAFIKKERAAEEAERIRKKELKALTLVKSLRKEQEAIIEELKRYNLHDADVVMQKLSEEE